MEYAPALRHVPENVLRRRHFGWTTPDHIHDSELMHFVYKVVCVI